MVAQWVKRDMGAPFYSHPIHGHYLPPEVIQACILRKLKADLVRAVGTDDAGRDHRAGLFRRDAPQGHGRRRRDGRPAGAGHRQRADRRGAGLRRGAAATFVPAGSRKQELNVLVYDLGGGTFDVTLLHLAAGKVQTLATDGDVQLGGHDWDQRLVDHAAESFLKTHGPDPRQDPATLNRLYQDAMETKHTLSARSRAVDPDQLPGPPAEVAVTREQFEDMSADLLERTAYTTRQLLAAAGLEWKQVDRILLVGGSTRMPMVARMLQGAHRQATRPDRQSRRGGRPRGGPVCRPPAGEAGGTRRPQFQVANVNAHSLGVEGIDTETLRKKNVVLIPRNSPLPVRHTERFATKSEGQRTIAIKVLEGRKLAAGRVHHDRPHHGPRSARRPAQGLAGGSDLRIRHQRPAGGRGPGAGHAPPGPAGVGPRGGPFQRGPVALEATDRRGGRVRRVRIGGQGRCCETALRRRPGRGGIGGRGGLGPRGRPARRRSVPPTSAAAAARHGSS